MRPHLHGQGVQDSVRRRLLRVVDGQVLGLRLNTSVLSLLDRAVDELSSVTPGKEARAMTSFANALR